MKTNPQIVCPWVTAKIFPNFGDPLPRVRAFFDHYAEWFRHTETVVLNFCAGNGDHILNYRGRDAWDDSFDWARYNVYVSDDEARARHNLNWLHRIRDGGEQCSPFNAGPSFILSEQVLTYRTLDRFYRCFREEAARRKLNFRLLEYLEPGPEFCRSRWKTEYHPEGVCGRAEEAGSQCVIDVCSTLRADGRPYAAFPNGLAAGVNTGDFVIAQTSAFVNDFGLDGIFLGNQFGLTGFWHPDNAPAPTAERRAGIRRFFHELRRAMGGHLIYWMDTYWPADVEMERWAMCQDNYAQLDAVMVSTFSVLTRREQVIPNVESRLRIAARHGGKPLTLFSLDFVDPWYWYRVYLDHRHNFLMQHDEYRQCGARCQGTSFFANDTFGQWVMPEPLNETISVLRHVHGWSDSPPGPPGA